MRIAEIITEAAAIAADLAEVKRRAMTYQRGLKERAAAHFGLTFAEVDLAYAEWAAIRARYLSETGNTC